MLRENHINRESRSRISHFSYTDFMNYTSLLAVVTPLSIYNGCSNRKTFRERKFMQVNMKNCGCCNVREHREIKNGEKYIALDIYLKFGNMENMK